MEGGEKCSYFPGCTSHSTAAEYDLSTNAVFKALGVELVEIDDWNCCGAAAVHSMNRFLSLSLPARNIAIAQKRDLELVVPCAGCFNMLKRAERALKTDPDARREIESTIGFTYRQGTYLIINKFICGLRDGIVRAHRDNFPSINPGDVLYLHNALHSLHSIYN